MFVGTIMTPTAHFENSEFALIHPPTPSFSQYWEKEGETPSPVIGRGQGEGKTDTIFVIPTSCHRNQLIAKSVI